MQELFLGWWPMPNHGISHVAALIILFIGTLGSAQVARR
jgi:hypothetical protein